MNNVKNSTQKKIQLRQNKGKLDAKTLLIFQKENLEFIHYAQPWWRDNMALGSVGDHPEGAPDSGGTHGVRRPAIQDTGGAGVRHRYAG